MGSAAIHRAHSQNSNQHSPYSTLYTTSSASPDRADSSTLDSLLFGDCDDAAAFATADNLSSCVQYLEPILRDLGLKQWQLHDRSPVAAVNRLYELVQQHQRVQEAREVAHDELHKAKVDAKVSSKTIQRLQGQVEAKQHELGALNIKLRQLDAWYREETERWSAEREELCRKCSQLEQRHTQWQHELRRRDVEFEKLQKHLATQISATERRRRVSSSGTGTSSSSSAANSTLVLTSSGTGNGSSTSTRSSRTPPNSARAAGGAASSNLVDTKRMSKVEVEDVYKRSVEAFEAERLGLESENAALRKALHSLEHEHKELLNRTHAGARCSGAGDSSDCLHGSSPLAGGSSSDGSPAAAGALTSRSGAAALAGADPAAALHRMHTNLQALKVRKQRVTGSTPLSDLQQQAESASERLLLAKLQEAGRIMEEQETALALALKAISHSGEGV